ncbi:unnamed protein product [Schistocephalus solidus]|uniref:Uncharacterized protein n=1 Tax=Schistocephalus solidus TaxID=70667 RepID=A0A183TJX9_SCHSO|nr:unnamed protein product [Schistocephalus solidus]
MTRSTISHVQLTYWWPHLPQLSSVASAKSLSSKHPWVLQADFHRRHQQGGALINDIQQAFRLLGRRAFPTLDAKALNTRVLEQLVASVRDPQTRKTLLQDRPPTLNKALALALEEEVLQATCEQPPRSLFSVKAVQPHSFHDASTQMPWQPCSCGSSTRRNNCRRPQTQRPNKPQARRTIVPIDSSPAPCNGENPAACKDDNSSDQGRANTIAVCLQSLCLC